MRTERVDTWDSAWDRAWHIIATSILLITGITISAISSVIQGEDVTALEKACGNENGQKYTDWTA